MSIISEPPDTTESRGTQTDPNDLISDEQLHNKNETLFTDPSVFDDETLAAQPSK